MTPGSKAALLAVTAITACVGIHYLLTHESSSSAPINVTVTTTTTTNPPVTTNKPTTQRDFRDELEQLCSRVVNESDPDELKSLGERACQVAAAEAVAQGLPDNGDSDWWAVYTGSVEACTMESRTGLVIEVSYLSVANSLRAADSPQRFDLDQYLASILDHALTCSKLGKTKDVMGIVLLKSGFEITGVVGGVTEKLNKWVCLIGSQSVLLESIQSITSVTGMYPLI
jgi:hypothetical protein